jgi:hypothetical protein
VETSDGPFSVEGGAYFDSNFSTVPLHEQGIERWIWGRLRLAPNPDGQGDDGERTLVFYQVLGESKERELRVLVQSGDAALLLPSANLSEGPSRRGRYGLRYPESLTIQWGEESISVHLHSPVDDSPFYQRFVATTVSKEGPRGTGIVEVLEPRAVDVPWQRPFVRMRTQKVGAKNSIWLPLFSGGPKGRLRRLVRTGRGA